MARPDYGIVPQHNPRQKQVRPASTHKRSESRQRPEFL